MRALAELPGCAVSLLCRRNLEGEAIYFFSKVSVLAGPWMRPSTGLE
jgi:hypothetical protein